MRKSEETNWDFILSFSVALLLLLSGIYLLIVDKVTLGYDFLTQQPSATGGAFFILFSLVLFYTGYHSLSPFSKIRVFLDNLLYGKKKK